MPNIPVFAQLNSRNGSLARGSFIKNGFLEKDGDKFYCFRRPGLLQYATNTSEAGQGITNFYSPDGDEYLLRAAGGYIYTMSTTDLTDTWIDEGQLATSTPNNMSAASMVVRLGSALYAIGTNSTSAPTRFIVMRSTDNGDTWTTLVDVATANASYPDAAQWACCAHNGKIFIANGYQAGTQLKEVWSSPDGIVWTQLTAAAGFASTATNFNHLISHAGNLYLFLAGSGLTTDPVWKSTDNGATWSTAAASAAFNTSGTARFWYGVVSDGTNMYVLGGSCNVVNANLKVYYSTNGASWAELGSNVLSEVTSSVTASNNSLEVVKWKGLYWLWHWTAGGSNDGKVWTSSDLQTWTQVSGTFSPSYGTSGAPYLQTGGVAVFYKVAVTSDGFVLLGYRGESGYTAGTSSIYRMNFAASVANTNIGSLGGNGIVDFQQNYARTTVVFKTGQAMKTLTVPGFTLTSVTDTDYPATTVRGLVYLDSYFFVMDEDGNIYNSASEDATSWAAADYIAAEFEPDGGVCLAKYQNYVVAFGEYTTEFFYNAGNATNSPLSPVQNGVMQVGCADGDTVVSMGESVIWLAQEKGPGQSTTNARFIALLEGTSFKRLSDHNIDRILQADDLADVDACAFNAGGHTYYHLRLGTSGISLVYDMNQSLWYVWNRRRTAFTSSPTGVVTASGTATWVSTHSFSDGDVGIVTGFAGTHTSLNGTYNMIVPASGTLCWNVGTAYSGTSSGTGTATGYSEDDFGVIAACSYDGDQLLQDTENGDTYRFTTATYKDDSIYMDWVARLPKFDAGTNDNKFIAWADFVSDRATGNVLLRHSDDDSQTWTKYRARSMSGERTRWNRLGRMRRRVFDLRVTDDVAVRAERLEYQMEGA